MSSLVASGGEGESRRGAVGDGSRGLVSGGVLDREQLARSGGERVTGGGGGVHQRPQRGVVEVLVVDGVRSDLRGHHGGATEVMVERGG